MQCKLHLSEIYHILVNPTQASLSKRLEVYSSCRHIKKFLLSKAQRWEFKSSFTQFQRLETPWISIGFWFETHGQRLKLHYTRTHWQRSNWDGYKIIEVKKPKRSPQIKLLPLPAFLCNSYFDTNLKLLMLSLLHGRWVDRKNQVSQYLSGTRVMLHCAPYTPVLIL